MRKRSRFVTVLGWFFAVVGGISVPVRALALAGIVLKSDMPTAIPAHVTHPIEVFYFQHATFAGVLFLIAALLMLAVGVGLIRRRAWAFPVGAVFLLLGGLRVASSLFLIVTGASSALGGLAPEQARSMTTMLGCLYSVALLWLMFLVWFFRRPAIQAEFSTR